jgi:hypothetical protein
MRAKFIAAVALLMAATGCGGGGGGGYTATITITPTSASTYPGATTQFTASIPNVVTPRIVWSVQEGAAGGLIDTTGLYTAPALAGTYHVVASGPAYNNAQSTVPVVVHVKVSVTPHVVTSSVGQVLQFSAVVSGTSNQNVTWSVQEGSAGGTVDSTGKYTAPTTPGIYHVVATSAFEPAQNDVATIAVGYGGASGSIN